MERTQMYVVSATEFFSKKQQRSFYQLSGIYYDGFGQITAGPLFTNQDTKNKFKDPGIYDLTYGPNNSVLDIKFVKAVAIP